MIARRYRPSGSTAGDVIMKGWIGTAIVASVLVLAGPASAETSAVAPQATKQTTGTAKATDVSARHRRYYRYGYRPYDRPYYYARPYYYRTYPYNAPAPFTFGFGFGPFW
jgi:hypothetical protein